MRILITGGLGQLGRALQRVLVDHELIIVDLPEVDIADRQEIAASIVGNHPDAVIHCAAYTNVDGCAKNPSLAYKVNAYGTQNVALACLEAGAALVHISTNEVFAGNRPAGYEEWFQRGPINVYGCSKTVAEFYIESILQHHYIVRTAWLYGPGGRNFIHAILNRARQLGELRVVADEVGNPTNVDDLARAIGELLKRGNHGIYHFVNEGACSRWAFAEEILRLAGLTGVANVPILGRDYRRASTPPPYGALLNINGASQGITLRPWQAALADYFDEHGLN